jgi:hypothetical protein
VLLLPRRALRTLVDVLALGGVVIFVLSTLPPSSEHLAASSSTPGKVAQVKRFLATNLPGRRSLRDGWPSNPTYQTEALARKQLEYSSTLICPTCNASKLGDFASSPYFSSIPLLSREEARQALNDLESHSRIKRYLIHHIPLAATISKAWMWDKSQNLMLNSYLSSPDNLLAYNFDGLELDRPTSYIYTRTGGKKLDLEKRLQYFGMHHETIHNFTQKVQDHDYFDGGRYEDRQLVYIVVRDESQLDPGIEEFFEGGSIREARQYACVLVHS